MGISQSLKMTLKSHSKIVAVLGLDLREREDSTEYDGIECLDVKCINDEKHNLEESSIMMSVEEGEMGMINCFIIH